MPSEDAERIVSWTKNGVAPLASPDASRYLCCKMKRANKDRKNASFVLDAGFQYTRGFREEIFVLVMARRA